MSDLDSSKFLGEAPDIFYEGNDGESQCVMEMLAFLGGGIPGAARLKAVLSSIFAYYMITAVSSRADLLRMCGLHPCPTPDGTDVTFVFRGWECGDNFRLPALPVKKHSKEDEGGFMHEESVDSPMS